MLGAGGIRVRRPVIARFDLGGSEDTYHANMRHGVSRIRTGMRRTIGSSFTMRVGGGVK